MNEKLIPWTKNEIMNEKKTNTFLICLSNTNKKYKAYISFENSSL